VAEANTGHPQVVAFAKALTKAAAIPTRLAFNGIGTEIAETSPPYDHAEIPAPVSETPGLHLLSVLAAGTKEN
jgi:hypothetical protein